jgi:hypothetical protein
MPPGTGCGIGQELVLVLLILLCIALGMLAAGILVWPLFYLLEYAGLLWVLGAGLAVVALALLVAFLAWYSNMTFGWSAGFAVLLIIIAVILLAVSGYYWESTGVGVQVNTWVWVGLAIGILLLFIGIIWLVYALWDTPVVATAYAPVPVASVPVQLARGPGSAF